MVFVLGMSSSERRVNVIVKIVGNIFELGLSLSEHGVDVVIKMIGAGGLFGSFAAATSLDLDYIHWIVCGLGFRIGTRSILMFMTTVYPNLAVTQLVQIVMLDLRGHLLIPPL